MKKGLHPMNDSPSSRFPERAPVMQKFRTGHHSKSTSNQQTPVQLHTGHSTSLGEYGLDIGLNCRKQENVTVKKTGSSSSVKILPQPKGGCCVNPVRQCIMLAFSRPCAPLYLLECCIPVTSADTPPTVIFFLYRISGRQAFSVAGSMA